MSITVLGIGKKHEDWVVEGIERYQKRLRAPFNVEWVLLPHSSLEGDRARQEESERIEKQLKSGEYVILLDETGKILSSPALSSLLHDTFNHSSYVTIIIGGAYGVNDSLRHKADLVWSLSHLVFPHQLVRLILIEQLYRAQAIAEGRAYHHD